MFETRLKILLTGMGFCLAILLARLVDMQILHADVYRQQAEDALLMPVKTIPAVRGRILDRAGRELVSEEPCWDVVVDYGVLAMDPAYLAGRVDRLRRAGHYGPHLSRAEVDQRFRADLERMWADLANFSDQNPAALQARREEICAQIAAIREAVGQRRGFESAVREERLPHAILPGLDSQQQVAARARLAAYPWVAVEDSTRRVYNCARPLAHIIGRVGPVTAEYLARQAGDDDSLSEYLVDEQVGVAGTERAAENLLRGRRGRYRENRSGAVVENVEPVNGRDVHLTIRSDLQQRLYDLLGRELAGHPLSSGGALVVLHVPTREVLALVSYPAYDPRELAAEYDQLSRDARRQPLRFRAVASQYAPGSIVKPLTCFAGLSSGRITLDTTFNCAGALFPDNPDRWRCWQPVGSAERAQHGPVNCTEAIKHSCNIFMYQTGELVGAAGLSGCFDLFGLGRPAGTGLPEEVAGINPTPDWLSRNTGRGPTPGQARLFAIGQGELTVTPVQAANLMAIYASGEYRPATLIHELSAPAAWRLPVNADWWTAIRGGLFAVVNEPGGTARQTAWLSHPRYALCGKTGSAEAHPWPISYRIPYQDPQGLERVAIQPANSRNQAIGDFVAAHPDCAFSHAEVKVEQRWPGTPPESGRTHSHAWFGGFLQEIDAAGQPVWTRPAQVAFAVLVEFGGSGGRTAAPIGRQAAEIIIETLGPDLNPDSHPTGEPPA